MGQRGVQRPWPQCLTQVRGPFRFRCRFTLSWLQKPRGKSFGLPKCVFEGVAILKLTLQMLSNFPGQPWKPCLRSTSEGLHVSPILCDRTTGLVICDCTCAPVPANATDIRYLLFYAATFNRKADYWPGHHRHFLNSLAGNVVRGNIHQAPKTNRNSPDGVRFVN